MSAKVALPELAEAPVCGASPVAASVTFTCSVSSRDAGTEPVAALPGMPRRKVAVHRQASLPDLWHSNVDWAVANTPSGSCKGCVLRSRSLQDVIKLGKLPMGSEVADIHDVRDAWGGFPSIEQVSMGNLVTNFVKIAGIFTPAGNVVSMGMTVGSMAGAEQTQQPVETTRSAVSLAMDSVSLGLWAGSFACPPLALAAVGMSAADFAINVCWDLAGGVHQESS